MKKIALLLALVLLLTLLPVQALAASNDKLIALTFDDGPASSNTQQLLDGLRERGAHCTFFLVGNRVSSNSKLIRQMWEDGHQIANHSYDHPTLTSLTDAEIKNQLATTDSLLNKALGFELTYMLRPPYGDYNERVLKAVNRPCFYWSMDTYDWKTQNANSVYNEFIKQAKNGSLVLLHDTHITSVQAALRAIDTLQAQGYEFVTVSELYYRRGIALENGKIYFNAYPKDYGTADGIKEPEVRSEINENGKQVILTGDVRGSVYYTLNGETPNPSNAKLYTGPFTIPATTTVKAVSVLQWNGLKSDVVTATVKYTPAETPAITLNNGQLSMECATAGATIYYTVDGSVPTKESAVYTEPIEAAKGTTYRAAAIAKGYEMSPAAMLTWTDNGNVFTDISVDDWCYEAVDSAVTAGVFRGVTATEFAPDRAFSRAMLVAVLYRIAGEPQQEELNLPFKDVSDAYWCADAISWAYSEGIISGYDDGSFKPVSGVSRQALCAMLARYMRYAGKDLSAAATGALEGFKDAGSISPAFTEDVDILCSLGVVLGYKDGTVRPQNGATRAQAATMLMRMLNMLDSLPDITPEIVDE